MSLQTTEVTSFSEFQGAGTVHLTGYLVPNLSKDKEPNKEANAELVKQSYIFI